LLDIGFSKNAQSAIIWAQGKDKHGSLPKKGYSALKGYKCKIFQNSGRIAGVTFDSESKLTGLVLIRRREKKLQDDRKSKTLSIF
jgi:hypothetical protein